MFSFFFWTERALDMQFFASWSLRYGKYTVLGMNFFSVIFSLLMTSSLRHLAVFCTKMSIFHPLTRHRMAQHTSLVPKFVSGGRPNWRLHELISKMSYQPLLWRHFRRYLADFWPKRPKSGVEPHEPIETAVDRMKNLMADLESPLNFASSYIYTFTGLDIKANILSLRNVA